jgi:hypothetical protein
MGVKVYGRGIFQSASGEQQEHCVAWSSVRVRSARMKLLLISDCSLPHFSLFIFSFRITDTATSNCSLFVCQLKDMYNGGFIITLKSASRQYLCSL